jgi:hypothetical protein
MPIASKIYGTVSADRQKEMSGLEFVQGLALPVQRQSVGGTIAACPR